MIFTSFAYGIFLAAVVAAYHLCRVSWWRKGVLLLASFIFYGYLHPRLVVLLLSCAVIGWLGALLIGRFSGRRGLELAGGVGLLLLNLSFFKYSTFISNNLLMLGDYGGYLLATVGGIEGSVRNVYSWLGLAHSGSALLPPLGISFYTFQCIGYLVDVYRRETNPERNPLNVLLFIAFFPQMVAGPIERAHHLLPQLGNDRQFSVQKITSALPLLLTGLIKKMVVADNMAVIVDKVYALQTPTPALLYLATVAFAFQIYCDFSGYTDIARASARMLGIDLLENFNSPYLARTPVEFWQRWHISFSHWIRDYLYIPLGGSRWGGMGGFFLVVMLTMGLSGLWHGAAWHYVVWGLYNGALVFAAHCLGLHRKKVFSTAASLGLWLINFQLILLGWLFFRVPSMSWLGGVWRDSAPTEPRGVLLPLILMIALYALPLALVRLYGSVNNLYLRGGLIGVGVCVLLVFARSTDYEFIYFRF